MSKNKISVWGYIKNYKWRSVFFSYFKIILLFIIIPFMLFNVIIYQYYNYILEQEIATSNMQTLFKTRSTVDMITNEIDKFYAIVNSNQYVQSFVVSKNDSMPKLNNTFMAYEIGTTLSNFISTSDCIETIYLYSKNSNYVFSINNSGNLNDFGDKSWYEEYIKRNSGNFTFSHTISTPQYTSNTITICRELYVYGKCDGLLVVNIDLNKLERLISRSHPSKAEGLYIADSSGTILYSNDQKKINTNLTDSPELEVAFKNNNTEDFTGKRYKSSVISSLKSEVSDWQFFSSISILTFIKKMSQVRSLLFISIAIAIVSSILLALYISLKIYKSITNIIAILQNPEDPDVFTNISEKNNSFNEILYICKNIINVMDSNKRIESELSQRLALLRKTQSIALQTQINPHFLFNTLHLVSLIIMRSIKGDNDATRIIALLSDLLRISLETKEHIVPLTLEIEHAKKYLQIQNIKYENKFDVEWDIQPEALNLKIVKLVLQPLIENSINHGITRLKNSGTIKISASVENKLLLIKVSDNGIGLTPEQIESIIPIINDDLIKENEHIGLSNVNQRIKLIFGEKFGVNISSVYGKGTEVTLTMPEISSDTD